MKNTYSELQRLFESTNENERFLVQHTSPSPLRPVSRDTVLQHIKNPLTGLPYDGIFLFGEFATISELNNNNRYYSKENYIEFVELLRKDVHSPKGVYGEFEHPKGYAVNGNNVTHKILDLWYDETDDKVYGYIMLLNNSKAEPAREIIKSGGQLGISARGGGKEVANNDGTYNAVLSLLVTYDIVYHPGFTSSLVGYEPEFMNLNESGVLVPKKLNQSTTQQKQNQQNQQKIMEQNQSSSKDKIEDELQHAVDNLNENFHLNRVKKNLTKLWN